MFCFVYQVSSHFEFFDIKEGKYNICMVSNEWTNVDKITIMTTVQSSTHKKEKMSILKSEVRGYIHNNNNNKTKQNIKKERTKYYSHVPAL